MSLPKERWLASYLEPKSASIKHTHVTLNLYFLGPRVYRRLKLPNVVVYQRRVMFTSQDDRQHSRRRHVLDLPNFVPHRRQRVGFN